MSGCDVPIRWEWDYTSWTLVECDHGEACDHGEDDPCCSEVEEAEG